MLTGHDSVFAGQAYQKIVGWGTGTYLKNLPRQVHDTLSYVVDNDPCQWGRTVVGKTIHPPAQLRHESSDCLVVVFSIYYEAIIADIESLCPCDYVSGHLFYTGLHSSASTQSDLARLARQTSVLIIYRHNFNYIVSGTSKIVAEQADYLLTRGGDYAHTHWKPVRIKGQVQIYYSLIVNNRDYYIVNIENMRELSRHWQVIIIHNIIDMPTEGLQALCSHTNQKIYYYLHDYYPLCTQINLLKNDRDFCDAPRMHWQPCGDCRYSAQQQQTYAFHQMLFADQRVVIAAPSEFVKNYYLLAFPALPSERITVFPHKKYCVEHSTKKSFERRIAFCGSQALHKGWPDFVYLAEQLQDDFEFYYLGNGEQCHPLINNRRVSFVDQGSEAMIKALLACEIDVVVLWSQCPETYCLVYYECLAAGCYVVANAKSGNVAHSIHQFGGGIVLDTIDDAVEYLQHDNFINIVVREALQAQNIRSSYDFVQQCIESQG